MRIDVLTLFPEACEPFFRSSILGRAAAAGVVTIACHNLRDYSADPHRKVDDRPFGGGPGMVLTCPPVFAAVRAVEAMDARPTTRLLLCPQGERFDQSVAESLSRLPRLLLIAGHYEGFDERIRLGLSPRELSVGDYVLSGGEAAAMVVVDAVARLIPGVIGHEDATREESFSTMPADGNEDGGRYLEYPQYTRPREFEGMEVPAVLMGGDHGRIRTWRGEQARTRTATRRPDLLAKDAGDGSETRERRP